MRKRLPLPPGPVVAEIESLDARGRGIARVDGRAVHIPGVLPQERVAFRYVRRYRRSDQGALLQVIDPHSERVPIGCMHFDICGGCKSQQLAPDAQLALAERNLISLLEENDVRADAIRKPLDGPVWGYRRRARLAVRRVPKKGGVLVGFREKASNYVADMHVCQVLEPRVGGRIGALRRLLDGLGIAAEIPQIEVSLGDEAGMLVLRHLAAMGSADVSRLRAFQEETGLGLALQPGGLDTVAPLGGGPLEPLRYELPDFSVTLEFLATDFIQVNRAINRKLVGEAIALLAPERGERLWDLFCGLGNFTLPIATSGCDVLGVDGEPELIERARRNAEINGIAATFESRDLYRDVSLEALGPTPDKVLLDPPRSGAREVVSSLVGLPAPPFRIVYVSCGPQSFAEDAALLTQGGYELSEVGVVDMFPHTGHYETLARFERR